MPAAKTYRIDELARFLMCAVEDNYNAEQALVPTDVVATMGLAGNIYQGDSEEIKFDGDEGVDIPQLTRNPYNGFEFELYGAASGTAGTAPIIGKLLRICGANEVITAGTDVRYQTADVNDADSGTFKMFQKAKAGEYLQYLTTGARGQMGFSFQDGGKSKFKIASLMGAYYEPAVLTQAVATDWGDQKAKLPVDTNFANTAELSFAGHQLCVQSLEISNIFGMETSRLDQPGCSSTSFKRVTPTMNITFRMPDWQQAFNPYKKSSTQNSVNREPFVLQIGNDGVDDGHILRIVGAGNNETQMTGLSQTILGDGNVGMTATLRCLSGLELIYK